MAVASRILNTMPHWHPCQVVRVSDGDTVRAQATLGLGVELTAQPVRLLGIQAPELHGPQKWQAQEARRTLHGLVAQRQAYIHVPGDMRDRYGRWLAWLWLEEGSVMICVNTRMLALGQAVEWWPQGWGFRSTLPPEVVRMPQSLTGR